MRSTDLATRISAAMALAALVAVLMAGAVAVPLVGRAARAQARQQLVASADLVATIADQQGLTGKAAGLSRMRQLLARQDIDLVVLRAANEDKVEADIVTDLRAGRSVSEARGGSLVEARPLANGEGVVLTEPMSQINSLGRLAFRRMLLALGIGMLGGAAAGAALAVGLARPLRRTATATQALAAGHREVRVEPSGPVEIARVASAVNDLAAALSASETRQREFLLSISHELRTPLTAVRGYAEALADRVVPPDRTAATGAVMLAEAQRLERLVDDLLDLARLQADEFPVNRVEVDLAEVVRAAGQVWTDRAAPAGVRVEVSADPALVHTDPMRVRQIIDGLAENALRVLEPGGLLVLALRASDVVILEVRDSGPGLSDTDVSLAFEKGALHDRYRGSRRVGTGIGLALIDGLARRLGATAAAGHAAEGGAAFRVTFPYTTRTPP